VIKNLLNLFFPKVCYACNGLLTDNERDICTICRHDLPITNCHFSEDDSVEKVFYGRVEIKEATALFRFSKKGLVQQLLHNLKYKGYEKIGHVLGVWLGQELKEANGFNTIDLVVPVPLHRKKLRKRGFNQVALFGIEIAKALNAEYRDDILIKTSATTTQVFKKRFARWKDGNAVFTLQNQTLIQGKHVLIVDDIITTGATIEACAIILQSANVNKISVATMAITD